MPEQLTGENLIKFALLGFLCYFWIYGIALLSNMYMSYLINERLSVLISSEILKKFLQHSDIKRSDSDKISILSQDSDAYRESWIQPHLTLIIWGSVVGVTIAYLLFTNLLLGILFALGLLLVPAPQAILNNKMRQRGKELVEARTTALAKIMDAIHGSQTLQNNGATKNIFLNIVRAIVKREEARTRNAYLYNISYSSNGITAFLGQIVPLSIGFMMNMYGIHISVAELISMYVASNQLTGPVQSMLYAVTQIQENMSVREKLEVILDEPSSESGEKNSLIIDLAVLKLQAISKAFGQKIIFKQLTLSFEMGKKYLIKGKSGAGKTTLLRLINGELVPDKGEIFALNQSGKIYSDYSRNVGIITQNPFLFNDSIRFNLTMGQSFDDKVLINALNRVGLTSEIKGVLDFNIENNGENISGGQRVRIEVARFLLRRKDILLVDEVTAALDPENARKVRECINSLPLMILEIAHHIDDEMEYDEVIDFDDVIIN
ncbi:ABC transporter ATP-binding protein [Lactovum odontotermitis]